MFGRLAPALIAVLLIGGCGIRNGERAMQTTLTTQQAAQRVDEHITTAIGQVLPQPTLRAGLKSTMSCDDPSDRGPAGRVTVEHRYTLPDLPRTANKAAFDTLAGYWTRLGYRILRDERDQRLPELAAETDDGFAVILTTNVVGELAIVGSSPCIWPTGKP